MALVIACFQDVYMEKQKLLADADGNMKADRAVH